MKIESLKGLPELTASSRKQIWSVAEQARLRLNRAQRQCSIDDEFRIDSGGRRLDTDTASRVSIDYAHAYFQAICNVYLVLRRPYRRLNNLLTTAMKFVYDETKARWKGLGFEDLMSLESTCLPKVRTALLDRRDQVLAESLQSQKREEHPRKLGFLEALSAEDPYYEVAKRFLHRGWADAHGLEAEAFAGRASFSDFIDGCVLTYEQTAEVLVAIRDQKSIKARCRKLDNLAKQFISRTTATIGKQPKRLGKPKATAAIDDLSRRCLRLPRVPNNRFMRRRWARFRDSRRGCPNRVAIPPAAKP